jgi:hypothetical protein
VPDQLARSKPDTAPADAPPAYSTIVRLIASASALIPALTVDALQHSDKPALSADNFCADQKFAAPASFRNIHFHNEFNTKRSGPELALFNPYRPCFCLSG